MNSDAIKWVAISVVALVLGKRLFAAFGDGRGSMPGGNVEPFPENGPDNPQSVATLTATQAGQIADAIEAAIYGTGLFSAPWEDEQAVIDALSKCRTDADLRLVMNAYGERGTLLESRNLAETIAEYFDAPQIAALNAMLRNNGLTLQF